MGNITLRPLAFLPLFLLCCALPAVSGLAPHGSEASEQAVAPESFWLAPLSELPSPLSANFAQSESSAAAANLALQAADQFYVVFGDGSATSVRLLSQRFSVPGTILQPLSTLDNPWASVALPASDFATEAEVFDPALLLKVGAAARSLSGGRQYQLDEFTMADAPYVLGGGFAGVWVLIGAAKVLRSHRSGRTKPARTVTRRRV